MAAPRLARLGITPWFIYAVVVLLLLTGGGLIFAMEADYRGQTAEDTRAKAELLADNVKAALDFSDAEAAQEAANAFSVNRRVRSAVVYDAEGARIAQYVRSSRRPGAQGASTTAVAPVENGDVRLGRVSVSVDRDPISYRIARYLILVLLFALAALLVFVSGRAQDLTRRANTILARQADELSAANSALTSEIAERERAEAARVEADALYGAYFENTSEHLFVIQVTEDERFKYLATNPACGAVSGFSTELAAGKEPHEIFDAQTAATIDGNYRRCLESGEVQHYRETLPLPAGIRSYETILVPIETEGGRIDRIMGSGRDMTERLRLEEALRQSQKMEAIGQLTGGIAHDFNNLLSAVVGSLDLISRKADDPARVKRLAEAGLQAAERGAKLTSQLLTFSRSQRLQLRPIHVSQLVSGMKELLSSTAGPLVRVVLDLNDEEVLILSDPTQLEMAVLNLVINARDAMPEGGKLTVTTRCRRIGDDAEIKAGDYVELRVADTGEGMPAEVLSRAVDPFFTTKEVGKGAGLGLSQAYGLARQGGGTLRIESEIGKGTTVSLYLKRTDAVAERASSVGLVASEVRTWAARILVVDDDADVRSMLAESLGALGYRIREARDGPEALAAIAGEPFDLMILDFAMPGMNGAEVAASAQEIRDDLPLIFVTGFSDSAAIDRLAGEDVRILRKPFRIDELEAAVGESLNNGSA